MNSKQAQEILLAYRAGTSDANDPPVAEALDQARRDPELSRWLEEQDALYKSVRTKLKATPVDAALKERILAAQKVVPLPIWRRNPTWFAAAAVLALLVGVTAVMLNLRSPSGFDAYRGEMIQFVAHGYKMDVEVESLAELKKVFAEKRWPFDYEVPKPLQDVPLEGGCAHTWRGHKVSLLCFETTEHKDIWLFVIDRAAVPHAPATGGPAFAKTGGLPTVSWVAGSKLYLLTGELDEESLKRLL